VLEGGVTKGILAWRQHTGLRCLSLNQKWVDQPITRLAPR
jgi:hypothetical protein